MLLGTLEDQFLDDNDDNGDYPTRDEVLCSLKQGLDTIRYLQDEKTVQSVLVEDEQE